MLDLHTCTRTMSPSPTSWRLTPAANHIKILPTHAGPRGPGRATTFTLSFCLGRGRLSDPGQSSSLCGDRVRPGVDRQDIAFPVPAPPLALLPFCLCLLQAWDLPSSVLICLDSNSEVDFGGKEQKYLRGVGGGFLRKRKEQLFQSSLAQQHWPGWREPRRATGILKLQTDWRCGHPHTSTQWEWSLGCMRQRASPEGCSPPVWHP